MTTTVTVKTHACPAEVKVLDYTEHAKGSHFSKTIEIIDPDSEHVVHLTDTRRVQITELPKPA